MKDRIALLRVELVQIRSAIGRVVEHVFDYTTGSAATTLTRMEPIETPTHFDAPKATRSGTAETVLAIVILLGVLVQAALAGQHIALGDDIALHGYIGSAVFALQILLVVILVVRKASLTSLVSAGTFVILLVAQIGLGYASRQSHDLVAMHIPLGVALFGVATWQIAAIRYT